jgi:hypothetical protein
VRPGNTKSTKRKTFGLLRSISVLFCLFCFSSCGKVGEPQAPYIRIPEPVKDLAAAQSGDNIVLTWTNPIRNIDGSAATNLAHVRIHRDGASFKTVEATPPGKPQSTSVPIETSFGSMQSFTVVIDTDRGKVSNPSNTASVMPVEVPGRVSDLVATVDQHRITLTWSKPQVHPELADAYVVTRIDIPTQTETVPVTRYDDSRYQKGKTVTYQLTAVRRLSDRVVTGIGPVSITSTIVDKTPPHAPTGLDVVESNTGAFVTWDANDENDLAGYHVYRSDGANGEFKPVAAGLHVPNSFVDPNYKPGTRYVVSAEDDSGNESPRSPAFP